MRAWAVPKAASLLYAACVARQMMLGRPREYSVIVLPAAMAAAIWFPIPEGWWFLQAALLLSALKLGAAAATAPLGGAAFIEAGAGFSAMVLGIIFFARSRKVFFPEGRL